MAGCVSSCHAARELSADTRAHRHRRPSRELFRFHRSRVLQRTALEAAANHSGPKDISVSEIIGNHPLVAVEALLFRCTGISHQAPWKTTQHRHRHRLDDSWHPLCAYHDLTLWRWIGYQVMRTCISEGKITASHCASRQKPNEP